MRHTFDCGIVGEAYDGAGAQFLAGMAMDELRERRAKVQRLPVKIVDTTTVQWLCDTLGGEVMVDMLPWERHSCRICVRYPDGQIKGVEMDDFDAWEFFNRQTEAVMDRLRWSVSDEEREKLCY
jgi:hypothetical protein